MKHLFLLIYIFLTSLISLGQKPNHESVVYQYQDSIFTPYPANDIIVGKEMEIYFNCCFNDSVVIYINNKIVDNVFLKTDFALSFTGYVINYKFKKRKQQYVMKIVLPNKNAYCDIILDKRYKILKINRMEEWEETWYIIFQNCRTEYL